MAISPIVSVGLLYSLLDAGDIKVRVQFITTFALLPLIWLALSRIAENCRAKQLVGRLLLLYVAVELVLMLLQTTFLLFGFGIAPNENYESMIPGSQFNSNNLACIVVALSIFYNSVSGEWPRWQRMAFNTVVLLILVITFSRLAIMLYIADRMRSLSLRQAGTVFAAILVLVCAGLLVNKMEYTGNSTVDTSLYKAKSLATIFEVGLEADSSTSSRGESYQHFFEKMSSLGFGSAEILNYSRYTNDGLFADQTLYINPHSMVVEFGYWMGWPGLIVLCLFLLLAHGRSNQGGLLQRGFVIVAVILITSIPSSAIPLPTLWVGILLLAMLGNYRRPSYFSASPFS